MRKISKLNCIDNVMNPYNNNVIQDNTTPIYQNYPKSNMPINKTVNARTRLQENNTADMDRLYQVDNSIEVNNINTSYTEKENRINDYSQRPQNNMYNPHQYQNHLLMKSKEFERIQKNIELENNSQKNNIINKMGDYSFRDVSKFLKHN